MKKRTPLFFFLAGAYLFLFPSHILPYWAKVVTFC